MLHKLGVWLVLRSIRDSLFLFSSRLRHALALMPFGLSRRPLLIDHQICTRRVRELLRISRSSPLPPLHDPTSQGFQGSRLALTSFLLQCICSRAPRERRDHLLRLTRGLASSTPSFRRHTDCARCRLVDIRGSPSRNPHTNTRVSPSTTVRLLLQHVTRRRFLSLHCRITSYLRSPYFPIPPLRQLPLCVPASHPSTSMSTPSSSSPTPPLVEVHSQPFSTH